MPPMKQCNHAGCRVKVPHNTAYCTKHTKVKGKRVYEDRVAKDEKYLRFYNSKQWRSASYQYRLNNPICEECERVGTIRKADVVDHIIEIKDNYTLRLNKTNFKSLCHYHHNIKTEFERKKRNKLRSQ